MRTAIFEVKTIKEDTPVGRFYDTYILAADNAADAIARITKEKDFKRWRETVMQVTLLARTE